MRAAMELIVKEALQQLAMEKRYGKRISQAKMASALVMSPRSFADIESGKSACGTLTAFLLVLSLDDPLIFLEKLKRKLEAVYYEEEVS